MKRLRLYVLLVVIYAIKSSENISPDLLINIQSIMSWEAEVIQEKMHCVMGNNSPKKQEKVWEEVTTKAISTFEDDKLDPNYSHAVSCLMILQHPLAQPTLFAKGKSSRWVKNSFLYRILDKPAHLKELINVLPLDSLLSTYERYDSTGLYSVLWYDDIVKLEKFDAACAFVERLNSLSVTDPRLQPVFVSVARYSGCTENHLKFLQAALVWLQTRTTQAQVQSSILWETLKNIIQTEQKQYKNRFISHDDSINPQRQQEWKEKHTRYQTALDLLDSFSKPIAKRRRVEKK